MVKDMSPADKATFGLWSDIGSNPKNILFVFYIPWPYDTKA